MEGGKTAIWSKYSECFIELVLNYVPLGMSSEAEFCDHFYHILEYRNYLKVYSVKYKTRTQESVTIHLQNYKQEY